MRAVDFRKHETKLTALRLILALFVPSTQHKRTRIHAHLCTITLWSINTYCAKLREMDEVAGVSDLVHTMWLSDFPLWSMSSLFSHTSVNTA